MSVYRYFWNYSYRHTGTWKTPVYPVYRFSPVFYAFDAEHPKSLITAKTYSCFWNIFWFVNMEDLLPMGVENFLIIPFVNYLYFLTYYFLIKLFVVFAELMWINQLLYIQNCWRCSHVAITLNYPDFKINSFVVLALLTIFWSSYSRG